ncbi:hypothetical protein HDU93_005934, partial [Gonapodya sp. JEL0774]
MSQRNWEDLVHFSPEQITEFLKDYLTLQPEEVTQLKSLRLNGRALLQITKSDLYESDWKFLAYGPRTSLGKLLEILQERQKAVQS